MIRAKILFLSLASMATLAAALFILELWGDFFDEETFIKVMTTTFILGLQTSFLLAVDYDLPASRRKWLLMGVVALSALITGLLFLQIWWEFFAWSVFVKLLGTMGVGIVLLAFLLAVFEDFSTTRKLKDKNYID